MERRRDSDHFEDICKQAHQILVHKIFSEIIDADQRVDAMLTVCIEALASTAPQSDELVRAIDAIGHERMRRALAHGA